MALSAAKLRALLLNTGLQQKDNPLYQVIYELIGTITALQAASSSSSSGGGGTITVNKTIQQLIDLGNSDSNSGDSLIPGPPGPIGPQGIPGPFIYMTEESEEFTIIIIQP